MPKHLSFSHADHLIRSNILLSPHNYFISNESYSKSDDGQSLIIPKRVSSKSIKEIRLNRGHIAEEIADIMVMLKQFQYIFLISDEVVKDIMSYKIDRQLNRINESN